MSEKFDNKLIINIKISRTLIAVLTAIHLGGMVLVLLVPLSLLSIAGLQAALVVSLANSLGTHGWRRTITALELDHEGLCSVQLGRDSVWHECDIKRAVIHPRLVLLWLQIKGRRWPSGLVLAADAVEPEAFRRLRARLPLETRAA